MSRSRPKQNELRSPVKHYLEWSGKNGQLYFFDKNKGEKGEKVFFKKLKFAVLDRLHTVSGFQRGARGAKGKGIRATEVWDVSKEPMTIWIGGQKHSTALYQELKGISGVKYAQVLYIGIFNEKNKTTEIGKLTLKGSSFSAFLNFLKGKEDYAKQDAIDDVYATGILINGRSKQKVNGDAKYYEPKYSTFDLTEEEEETLTQLDEELQEYLEARGGSGGSSEKTKTQSNQDASSDDEEGGDNPEEEEEETEEEHEDAEDVDDLPF